MDHTYPHVRARVRPAPTRDLSQRAAAPTDAELVTASLREPDAFSELFARHWDDLFRFCLNRAGSAGEDIAAEAFRVAFDRRTRYDPRYGDARPWLFGIATNLLRDHFRAARREERKLGRSAVLHALTRGDAAPDGLERQLLGPQLAAALQGIPSANRDALLLMAWADLDYEQIAAALDVPVGTVRSRIHRARQRMRENLDAHDDHRARTREG
jgi:RNA polymerase sigma-70 factor (ECF subfamily)